MPKQDLKLDIKPAVIPNIEAVQAPGINEFTKTELSINKDGFYITWFIYSANTSSNYGVIFTAYRPCELVAAIETHAVAGSDAGAVTLTLEKLTSGQALDAGSVMLSSTFNLKATANTPQIKEGTALSMTTSRQLDRGERVALKDAGVLTDVTGVQVTLYFKFLGKGQYR